MNSALLESGQHSARHYRNPARANFASFENLSANSKALGLNG
jgi:hypothetical protein